MGMMKNMFNYYLLKKELGDVNHNIESLGVELGYGDPTPYDPMFGGGTREC